MIYTDDAGQEWLVREIVSYASATSVGEFPLIDRSALVFERKDERRVADDAPLDWRDRPDALDTLFARAQRLQS